MALLVAGIMLHLYTKTNILLFSQTTWKCSNRLQRHSHYSRMKTLWSFLQLWWSSDKPPERRNSFNATPAEEWGEGAEDPRPAGDTASSSLPDGRQQRVSEGPHAAGLPYCQGEWSQNKAKAPRSHPSSSCDVSVFPVVLHSHSWREWTSQWSYRYLWGTIPAEWSLTDFTRPAEWLAATLLPARRWSSTEPPSLRCRWIRATTWRWRTYIFFGLKPDRMCEHFMYCVLDILIHDWIVKMKQKP